MDNAEPTVSAHVITADAQALGTPGLFIMQPDRLGGVPLILGRYDLDTTFRFVVGRSADSAEDLNNLLRRYGWCPVDTPRYIEPGYLLVEVESVTTVR